MDWFTDQSCTKKDVRDSNFKLLKTFPQALEPLLNVFDSISHIPKSAKVKQVL